MPPLFNRRPEPGLPSSLPPVALPLAELLVRVRQTLETRFADSYWVLAEIADLTLPRFDGAHCYLVLTDQHTTGRGAQLKAQARATIWSQRYQQLAPAFAEQTGQELRVGLKLMLRVQVKFHEQYGLSLDVLTIDPTYTVGELARQRLETVRRLEAQGLLERQKKLALALGPQRLAVVSSPTAAGFQDFVQQLSESAYDFAVSLFPAAMQGTESPASIRAALDQIRPRRRAFDAVIIIRGGGSKTDLLAFDDYGLAAAVGAFPLPVITGIGHERDEAVLDLAAHTALKTPTAVAAFLAERLGRLDAVFGGYAERIREVAAQQLADRAGQLSRLGRFTRQAAETQLAAHQSALRQQLRAAAVVPRQRVREQQRQLARLAHALPRAARRQLLGHQTRLRTLGQGLSQRFRRLHRRRREQLLRQRYQLQLATERRLHRAQLHLLTLDARALPESATLARHGYVQLLTPSHTAVPRPGDTVRLVLPATTLTAQITASVPVSPLSAPASPLFPA
ncbi:Exodeoxyribonuclease VII large subunit [Hymenobacter daecheongensis DSM 21074]|uniref:Exodeoxyribonuclease 7 large subunit n=1 Tax=Hymenobacter daecheongensis DSM 21074 TaxID=1121955 RepID=A0A1M6G5J1_9BACT|nr:exodeoxyribonuclease VII large subunit [Hymenobacter daecheongensis]SHJ05209.1 Exodeoxyribonuclease VII large subunit [Hymenobacter daecheongensis DSM 21074]